MTAICRNCGENVDLGNALQERRQVVCPSCGIVVVRGVHVDSVSTKQSSDSETETGKYPDWAVSDAQEVSEKKKLGIIRPKQKQDQDRYGGLYDAEKRAKMYEEIKHKLWMRKLLKNAFEVFILLGTLLSTWFIYKAWDTHLEHKKELAKAERAAEDAREAERLRLRREEQERERARIEAERAAMRAEKEREEQARRYAEQEKHETIETYKLFTYALRENDFDIFSKSVTNCLSKVGGEMCYMLPQKESIPVLYWAVGQTNGEIRILRIDESGGRVEVEPTSFFDRVAKLDYLVAGEGKVYYHARRKNPLWGRLSKTQESDPSKTFFAGLYEKLETLKPTYEDIRFDIVFVPKSTQQQIICDRLEFGCNYSLDKVRCAVEEAFPPGSAIGVASSFKKFKRTVKLWNGASIKQGVDGITYVPRSPPASYNNTVFNDYTFSSRIIYRRTFRNNDNRERWNVLYNQALQEDKEEEEYYRRQKQNILDRRQRNASSAENAYAKRIDKIINDGELYYHVRKKRMAGK